MKDISSLQRALDALRDQLIKADRDFDMWAIYGPDDFDNPSWPMELCFLQLLAVTEASGLTGLRAMIESEYLAVKGSRGGFSSVAMTPEDDPYSPVSSTIRKFIRVLESFFPVTDISKITTDVFQIIRDIHYVITNKALFASPPANEKDVHLRIEAILKGTFPDLRHKPRLTKQIKAFEPDTGIPSVRILIEYKYLAREENVSTIADEILADTRGYHSKDWEQYLWVIYETDRFRNEKEWNQMLRDAGVPTNASIVVLSGVPPTRRRKIKSTGKTAQPGVVAADGSRLHLGPGVTTTRARQRRAGKRVRG